MTPQPPSSQASGRTPSSLPIVALVFSVLGFCFPPLLLVGIILGIVSLVQAKGSQPVAIISVVLPVVAIPVVGILAAIAIPNFIKFQARSKQTECKAQLRSAYTALKSYEMEKGSFDVHPAEVGFAPERGNRYLYAFSRDGHIAANSGRPAKDDVGIGADTAKWPEIDNEKLLAGIPQSLSFGLEGKGITVVCAGNVDMDKTIDVWSVSTEDRPGAPAGVPFNDVSDITD